MNMLYWRMTCANPNCRASNKGTVESCRKCGAALTGGSWWYRFRFAGRIIHESAKTESKTVAREAERQRRRGLEESWNQITRRALPPTFEKAATEWLRGREGRVSHSTHTIDRVALSHLLPLFGSKLLCDIVAKDVEAYQQGRIREGAQGRTVNIEVQALRQVLKANKCWKHLDGEIHALKERKDVGRALTPEEEGTLLEECAKADSACYTTAVLALNTAMRKDEIRKLTWKQIDLFERVLTVGKSKTDAGTGRAIPLNAAAVRALTDWAAHFPDRKPEHYVFPQAEGNTPPDPTRPAKGWRTAWRTATRAVNCPKCGERQRAKDTCRNPECKSEMKGLKNPLAGLRFHDLRHAAITKLAESQASDQTIMSIAGHVSRAMLEHYSHIRMVAKRAALDSIATALPEATAYIKQPAFRGVVNQNCNQMQMAQNRPAAKLLN